MFALPQKNPRTSLTCWFVPPAAYHHIYVLKKLALFSVAKILDEQMGNRYFFPLLSNQPTNYSLSSYNPVPMRVRLLQRQEHIHY